MGRRGEEVQRLWCSGVLGVRGVLGFWGSGVQGFRGSGVQRFRGSEVQRFSKSISLSIMITISIPAQSFAMGAPL
jgi:hypothetical protein